MRTKDEIERSLAEMKRMADDARRGLAKAKEMNATVLVKHFEQWETKCEARAQILSWVLGRELSEDVQPQLPQAPVSLSLPPNLSCSICGYFCNNYHHHNCWFEVEGQSVSPNDAKPVLPAVFRHKFTGFVGHLVKEYKPTGKPLTMQIKLANGWIYFAPKHEFELVENGR